MLSPPPTSTLLAQRAKNCMALLLAENTTQPLITSSFSVASEFSTIIRTVIFFLSYVLFRVSVFL